MSRLPSGSTPRRASGVVSRVVGDEFVVIHPETQTAHALSGPLAQVWREADGDTTPHLVLDDHLRTTAIAELQALGLLRGTGVDRRALIKRGGAVGGLTVGFSVASIALPLANAAASGAGPSQTTAGLVTAATIPAATKRIDFTIVGAGGAGRAYSTGGSGRTVTGNIRRSDNQLINPTVSGTPGTLQLGGFVGGGGEPGGATGAGGAGGTAAAGFGGGAGGASGLRPGAGGGGATTITIGGTTIVVAGAGGGGGVADAGAAGNGGTASNTDAASNGGTGNRLSNGSGGNSGGNGGGGGNGSPATAGAGQPGVAGQGGAGGTRSTGTNHSPGGGGGGGYSGGGGGGDGLNIAAGGYSGGGGGAGNSTPNNLVVGAYIVSITSSSPASNGGGISTAGGPGSFMTTYRDAV